MRRSRVTTRRVTCAVFTRDRFTTDATRSKACLSVMPWPPARWRPLMSRSMSDLASVVRLTSALLHRALVRSARNLQAARRSSRALMVARRCAASKARAVPKAHARRVQWLQWIAFPIRRSGARVWWSTLTLTNCSHSSTRLHCSAVSGDSSKATLTPRRTKLS